jgi:hypothetical protein
MTQLEDVVRRYYEAFNARDYEAYARLFTSDCVVTSPGVELSGLDNMRAFDQGWIAAFPDARLETLRMLTAKNTVMTSNWINGGKHKGALRTPHGEIPAKGADFRAPYCARFVMDGQRIKRQEIIFHAEALPLLLSGE